MILLSNVFTSTINFFFRCYLRRLSEKFWTSTRKSQLVNKSGGVFEHALKDAHQNRIFYFGRAIVV